MTTVEVVVVGAIAIAALWAVTFGQRLPKALRERACQGRAWRRAFPDAPKGDIREFLAMVASAFMFAQNQRLKLGPNDQLLQIYRARYPVENWPDALELETLSQSMRNRYGVDLAAVWHDQVTLGELFGTRRQRGNDA